MEALLSSNHMVVVRLKEGVVLVVVAVGQVVDPAVAVEAAAVVALFLFQVGGAKFREAAVAAVQAIAVHRLVVPAEAAVASRSDQIV
jgi:hypothetical protein